MPRTKRRRFRERQDWTDEHKRVLCGAWDVFMVFDPHRPPLGIATRPKPDYTDRADVDAFRRQAWLELRSEILSEWTNPHAMPWAWWKYERGIDPPADQCAALAKEPPAAS